MSDSGIPTSNRLRENSLGVGGVAFGVMSAAAPLAAIAGGGAIGMLMGNGTGYPTAYAICAIILLVFSVGYISMSRHVVTSGGFYAFAARGLGGTAGGITAMISIFSYSCLQFGIYGLFSAAAAGLFSGWGLDLPWWGWAFVAMALTAVLGYRQVDLSMRVLFVLVMLEFAFLSVLDLVIIFKGGAEGLNLQPFTTTNFFTGSPALGLLLAFGSFIGFEATTIYREEARDPDRTIPRATYLSVLLIGGFYLLTGWCMVMGVGMDKLMTSLQGMPDPTLFLFALAEQYLGHTASVIMNILYVSSLFAAVLAFHNAVARYLYIAGRERLLPEALGATHYAHKSPHAGSVVQTLSAAVVIGVFAFLGLDPIFTLFSWFVNTGTLGIMMTMTITSLAIVSFCRKNPTLVDSPWSSAILPLLAFVILAILVVLVSLNFQFLSGAAGSVGWVLQGLIIIAGVVGFLLSRSLRRRNRSAFDKLGMLPTE